MQSGPLVAGLEFGSGQRAKLLSKPFILFNLSASLSSSNCLSPLRSGCGLKTSGDGGSLSVCSFQPQVKELFEIAQFMTAYAVHDTREAAVAAAKAS